MGFLNFAHIPLDDNFMPKEWILNQDSAQWDLAKRIRLVQFQMK
jgi:hypothetical protein